MRDLAVTLCCVVVAAGLLVSQTGATRDLSQTQTCMNNLRQLFAGMTAYVNQYNSFPPNGPYPTYMASETVNGVNTGGWDPNIGFIMTHGLGLVPPAKDTTTGHFKWYGTAYADLPDVCKCPAMSPALLDPANPEVADPALGEGSPLETLAYQYALSYQTSGTCRAATPVVTLELATVAGTGGRCPAIPDPSKGTASGQPYNNAQRGMPGIYVFQHSPMTAPNDPSSTGEYYCWIQAIHPAEVQAPSRTYYLSDSRDYRPQPKGTSYCWPPGGCYNGWMVSYGNQVFTSGRHFGFGNVLYLDGRVSRDGQEHNWLWALDPSQPNSNLWRIATFSTDIRIANVRRQWSIMPVLRVRGWEYFFSGNGMTPR